MATTPTALRQDKFVVEKAILGDITLLTMTGTLNEAFEGRKVAEAVRTKKLVVNMRNVKRFASWGMSEWMDFLKISAERDLYLVECSTYAVSQINLVTGLMGHGKLTSFYSSYRCGSCSEEFETLFLIPRDREAIRELPGSQQECPTCGGNARLEEYPAAFFETIADRPSFEIDDEVLAMFRTRYGYNLAPDLTRFRAFRAAKNGYTYLRLSGNLGTLPPEALAAAAEGTTVIDLEHIVFDRSHLAPWRAFVKLAMAKASGVQLLGCPPGFIESALAVDDLRDKLKVRTFAYLDTCPSCETIAPYVVDVAENLEQLVGGTLPSTLCRSCQAMLVPALTAEQITLLRALPARDRDVALDKFLTASRVEPADKLDDCLRARRPVTPKSGRGGYIAAGLAMTALAGGGVAYGLLKKSDAPANVPVVAPLVNDAAITPPRAAFVRPDWILSNVPSSAYCHDLINRLMCVGVSSYRATRDEAVAEANDIAIEELVSVIGLKISEPVFRENVLPGYSTVRASALSALQAADLDRTSAAYTSASDVVRKARTRVVEILRASGGAAVPNQRSDWYWEEYAAENGKGNETLVFVRYDVNLDSVRALVEKYSTTTAIAGTTAMTAFPAMAWQHADFAGGALVTKVSKPFATAGVAPLSLISNVDDRPVTDAPGFAVRLKELATGRGDFKVTVKMGTEPSRVVNIRR